MKDKRKKNENLFDIQKILYNEEIETDIIQLEKGSVYSEDVEMPSLIVVTKGIIELKYKFENNFTKYVRISDNEAFYFKKGSYFSIKGINKSKIIKIRIFR